MPSSGSFFSGGLSKSNSGALRSTFSGGGPLGFSAGLAGGASAAMRLAIGEAILFHQGIGARRKEERLRYLRNYWARQLSGIPNIRFHTSFDADQSCGITLVEALGSELMVHFSIDAKQVVSGDPDAPEAIVASGFSPKAAQMRRERSRMLQ